MKSPLLISIERLHVEPLRLDIEVGPEELDLIDEEQEFEFHAPVALKVQFSLVGQEVLAQGTLHTTAESACVRCLEPVKVDLRVPVQETWFHASPDEQRELEVTAEHTLPERTYQGEELNVTEDLRELIMAELPERTFCREDCRGLCPGCGANLNSEPCRCHPAGGGEEERLPEWKKALKNLKLNEK